MSRIGKKLIAVPDGVTVEQKEGRVIVQGQKGTLELDLYPGITVSAKNDDSGSFVAVEAQNRELDSAMWGTVRALIANMIKGVGFRMEVKDSILVMRLGFSHPVEYLLPAGVVAKVENGILTLTGIDRQVIGQVAAEIRAMKKPEPYKGKGFKYQDEIIRRKAGKTAKGE